MMTDEQLDRARYEEALRRVGRISWNEELGPLIARLAREGWTPVDPLLIEAREIVANHYDERGYLGSGKLVRDGLGDDMPDMQCTLAGIKRGIEIGKARA